ncbi:unannotated protein [freshwater metagenome]|uniref:Unannotated protein n=1 Tax=freshwater metagenome TaxID=449393 RepID=A0A6J7DI87_9ZZZZ
MRRRAATALAAAVLLVAGVVVSWSLFGAGRNSIAGPGPTTASTADGGATTVAGATAPASTPPVTTVPATTLPATTLPDAGRTPTTTDPARVYIAGDSDAGAFAPYLETLLAGTGVIRTTLDYKVSSGLARPDFYDWPAHFATQLPVTNPDIVIVTFGGNDGQPIHGLNKQVDSPEWRAEYGKRVGSVMDLLGADGRTLIWVGIPNDNEPVNTARLKIQDEVVRDQVAKHPTVVYIDSWNIFSGLDGGYAEYVVDPRDGVSKKVRSSTDGFHLNSTGAEILALHIAVAVQADLRERGAAM